MRKTIEILKKVFLGCVKLNHWAIFMLVIFLGITGILGCTVFLTPVLVDKLDFGFALAEIEGGKAAKALLSKLFRGQMWELHYIAGLVTYGLLIFGLASQKFRLAVRKNPFILAFLLILTVLFVTGWIRYYRGELSFTGETSRAFRDGTRTVHRYASWALLVAIVGHLIHIIYLENTKYKGIISNMFKNTKFFLRALFLGLLILGGSDQLYAGDNDDEGTIVVAKRLSTNESDKFYKEAMQYYNGKKGFVIVEKEFPNCPYDACKQNNDRVEQVDKADGSRLYKIKLHDFKSAKALFDKSIDETNNPLSAEYNLFMLLERINYKDKEYSDYLLTDMKQSLGVSTEKEYKEAVAKYIPFIGKTNSCRILYKSAEIYEKGYADIPVDSEKAAMLYGYAKIQCKPNSLFGTMLKNK